MQGIFPKRNGKDYSLTNDETMLTLIGGCEDLEIMLQTIKANEFVWLTPGDDPGLEEFIYILDGSIKLEKDSETVSLDRNDFFSVAFLTNPVLMKCDVDVKLLYISTKPVFNYLSEYAGKLDELINQVDEKDRYTKHHSQHVLDYSIAISKRMGCSDKILENLAVSALFHDVGKCYIPDEILKKPARLTADEFKYIYKHPLNSKKLIEPNFGGDIAYIALCHHERLDGSGYPLGLMSADIPLEARIIAVADSFDAMTTKRPYNIPKTFLDAARELASLTRIYDREAVGALLALVEEGKIKEASDDRQGKV